MNFCCKSKTVPLHFLFNVGERLFTLRFFCGAQHNQQFLGAFLEKVAFLLHYHQSPFFSTLTSLWHFHGYVRKCRTIDQAAHICVPRVQRRKYPSLYLRKCLLCTLLIGINTLFHNRG